MRTKLTIFFMILLLLLRGALLPISATEAPSVYVTIVNDTGKIVLAQQEIPVTDTDQDNKLTINDALFCAHEQAYQGGAAAGYGSEPTAYGLSLTKLWGVDNGGAYGYYLNDKTTTDLGDRVTHGDRVTAFIYTDTAGFTDTYCYFEPAAIPNVKPGDQVTLTLQSVGLDPVTFAPVDSPVADAQILIDGKDSGITTDARGQCTLHFTQKGVYAISAVSGKMRLVPPLCLVSVGITQPVTIKPSDSAMQDLGSMAEWYVFALQMNTDTVADDALRLYRDTLLERLSQEMPQNAVTRQKIALAGLSVLDPAQTPAFQAYLDEVMADSLGSLGTMSWVFGLHLMNNGQTSAAYTQEQVIQQLLALQQDNGAWGITATAPDVDATAMTLCALADHQDRAEVQAAIDKALAYLSAVQGEDGTFSSYGVSNAESCAQVGLALVCLDVEETDARFVKNGKTVWDGLKTFYTGAGYAHIQGDSVNAMATAQGLLARSAQTAGQNPFAIHRHTFAEIQPESAPSYKLPVCIGLTVLAAGVIALLSIKKKRALRHILPVIAVWLVAMSVVLFVKFQSPEQYQAGVTKKENPIGTVTFSVAEVNSGTFQIEAGDTVLDLLREAGVKWNVPMVVSNTGYVSEMAGRAEFEEGPLSGWKYRVNGQYATVSAADYVLHPGDEVEWVYTVNGLGDTLDNVTLNAYN